MSDVWANIQELKATIRQQAAPEVHTSSQPIPYLQIAVLTELMAELQAELDELHALKQLLSSPSL
ncbi:hypothetical protein DSO57_1025958 [Entomophthora muscae]|uniref:Uncharacterized protein n=1 Tax=Entomophthora muscae TaxID=34485 RepID=A0ACC2SR47_9FUNG|nr:hypothetical protein DSO57_1025958 [Entomophthora muscae]